ncbi:hypothetical protein SAMN05660349_02754 [Macellibacteroides fermentans]|jgi:hypothetical protein|uniref:Uncharacterized protein n=1 Tax=Parabacteroides chartae TaxID=1037355 RepID=A0A1T5E2Z9_9BACT|nr:hypothetical protein SAMN05660349_02754 [Parabacteroides chartae]
MDASYIVWLHGYRKIVKIKKVFSIEVSGCNLREAGASNKAKD